MNSQPVLCIVFKNLKVFGKKKISNSPRPASEAALLRDLTNIVNQRNEQLFILLQYTNALKKETLSENGGVNRHYHFPL